MSKIMQSPHFLYSMGIIKLPFCLKEAESIILVKAGLLDDSSNTPALWYVWQDKKPPHLKFT